MRDYSENSLVEQTAIALFAEFGYEMGNGFSPSRSARNVVYEHVYDKDTGAGRSIYTAA